jgi:hypothetical protein
MKNFTVPILQYFGTCKYYRCCNDDVNGHITDELQGVPVSENGWNRSDRAFSAIRQRVQLSFGTWEISPIILI